MSNNLKGQLTQMDVTDLFSEIFWEHDILNYMEEILSDLKNTTKWDTQKVYMGFNDTDKTVMLIFPCLLNRDKFMTVMIYSIEDNRVLYTKHYPNSICSKVIQKAQKYSKRVSAKARKKELI